MEEVLHFKVDPLWIIRTMLQIHVENVLEDQLSEAETYALYACIQELTDEETEALGHEYGRINNLDFVSLSGTVEQREAFYKILIETDRYKKLLFENQCQGYAGMGVADILAKKFYPCAFAEHWKTLMRIMEEEYWEMDTEDTKEMDAFILNNFELVGGTEEIEHYTKDKTRDRFSIINLHKKMNKKQQDLQMMRDSLIHAAYSKKSELDGKSYKEIEAMYGQMRAEID
ncbi:hypothetical protein [Listeria rocourtiae]|uniref:hypothetical protein n=1 Tax=Listeria rocourtiae TaxID=647910 RepID=UPI003D2F6C7D